MPKTQSAATPAPKLTKVATVTDLISRSEGASLPELMAATGWQAHSVRGALSGAVSKAIGKPVTSEISDGVRRYRTPLS